MECWELLGFILGIPFLIFLIKERMKEKKKGEKTLNNLNQRTLVCDTDVKKMLKSTNEMIIKSKNFRNGVR